MDTVIFDTIHIFIFKLQVFDVEERFKANLSASSNPIYLIGLQE